MIAVTVETSDALSPERLREQARLALNKTVAATRAFAIRKTTETYRLSSRQLGPYVRVRRVSQGSGSLEGAVELQAKAIPIEAFKPTVVSRRVTYQLRGRTVTRRVYGIAVQRFVDGSPKFVPGAFPLQQRRAGRLRAGDRVRRRIGAGRNELTNLRYYTFPRRFIREDLQPAVQAFVPERFQVEFRAARRVNAKVRGRVQRVVRQ